MRHELIAADAGVSFLSLLAYPFAALFIATALLIYAVSFGLGVWPDWKP
jgi:hypothetical protein